MNCTGDAVAPIPLPLSGVFITPRCRHKHLTFPKAQPKTQPASHSQPWHGELILLHTEPSPASSHHLSGVLNGIAFLLSRNEEMEGGHGNEKRQRQLFMQAGSREGSGTHRCLQGRGSPREVLFLGSASRHLLCSPVFWEVALKQDLGSKSAGVLCGGFSALHKGQQ